MRYAKTVEACANTEQLLHNLQTEIDIVQDGQNPKLTSVLRAAKSAIRAQSITPSADAELIAQNIANEMDDEKSGFWRSCSGCHEHNEGVPTGPMSKIFRCNLGTGCSECGGIGVVWDNFDYSALAAKEPK